MRMSPDTVFNFRRTGRRSPTLGAAGSGIDALPLTVEMSASTRMPLGRPIRTSPEMERTEISLPSQ